MRNTTRAILVALFAILSAVVIGTSATTSTMSAAVRLLGSYALKGAQVPVFNIESDQSIRDLALQYGGGTTPVIKPVPPVSGPVTVVQYPASWRPFSPGGFSSKSWDQSVREGVGDLQTITTGDPNAVIFGYSQGAVTASEFKKVWNAQHPAPGPYPHPTFVLLGNGDRPNGGILARFAGIYIPGLDMTTTGATPTETSGAGDDEITTVDIAGQYDPIADAPLNPLNPFAMANSAMGTLFVHLNYADLDPGDAVLQDTVGDTQYYLIPTYPVPLLMPVQMIPGVGPIAADMLDPLVRLLVESGYDRTISPGQPTKANFLYFPNPIKFVSNIPVALATGLDNGLEDVGADRALNTTRPEIAGPSGQDAYGIGGPPVTVDTTMVASNTVNTPAPQNLAPQDDPPPPPSAVEPVSNDHFGVHRPPFFAKPGQPATLATNSSNPKPATAVKSALSGVTQSIKAVTKTIKDVAGSLKPKKPSTADSTDAAAS